MTSGEPEVDHDPLTFSRWVGETLLRWRMVVGAILLTAIAAALAVILLPPVYRARASFVANASSSSRLPSSLSSSGALAGLASQFGVSSGADPSESPNFYMQLLESRELLTRLLLSRFPDPRATSRRDSATLLDILRVRNSDPRRRLEIAIKRMSKAIVGNYDMKTNLVWFNVDAQWPDLSSEIANRTTELVTAFNKEQRVSRTRSKRLFLEERVSLAKAALEASEARLREFYEQNRSWRASPSLVSEEQSLQRDSERAANLYLQLQQQMETTLLDEVNNAPLITVVDSAVPPRKAEWPRYGILLVSTVMSGFLIGIFLAGSVAIIADWRRRNPQAARELSTTIERVRSEMRLAGLRRARSRTAS